MKNTFKYLSLTLTYIFLGLSFIACKGKHNEAVEVLFYETEDVEIPKLLNDDPYRTQGGYAYYYHHQHGEKTMPICAWYAPPPAIDGYPNQITIEDYQTLAASGINTIYELHTVERENRLKGLYYANEVGLVYYVHDETPIEALNESGYEILEEKYGWYMNKPAYGGNLLKDEPGLVDFEKIATAVKEWSKSKYGNVKHAYVNHMPSYAESGQLYYGAPYWDKVAPEEIIWADYVKEYISLAKPAVYSYDFYPYWRGDKIFDDYFKCLSTAKREAAKGNIPFWNFIQVGNLQTMHMLTYSQFSWQVQTSLAYGVKGIQWFCYWQPLGWYDQVMGLVDRYGNKTIYYDMVQKINAQIAAVDEVLMQCAQKGVIQMGNSPDALPEEDKLDKFEKLVNASAEGDAIIGCFEYRDTGKSVYYVVCNSDENSAKVQLAFDKNYAVKKVQDATATHLASCEEITINLPAGEGALVVVG